MKTTLTKEQKLVIADNNGLSRYLRSLTEGKDPTPRSWLYEDQNADEVRDRWLEQLKHLQDGDHFEEEVFQFDTSQLEKWGPQGGVAPVEQLDDVLLPTFGDFSTPKAFSSNEWRIAKMHVTKSLLAAGIRQLRPASYRAVVDDMRARDVLESNSGWPDFTRRSKPDIKSAAVEAAISGAWKEYPAIALFRNYRAKTRLVWMFPMATNLVEGTYYQPLMSAFTSANIEFFAPWKGFDTVRELITREYGDPDGVVAASDFSATDAHFRLHATMEVYQVLSALFKPEYRDGLRESLVHMHTIPLIIGPDSMLTGEHGVASGSNWTNFIETVFDMVFAEYVRIKENQQNQAKHAVYTGLYAIGDDMSWTAPWHDDKFAKRLERYAANCGQITKAEKTTNDPNKVKSLQRLFQRGYRREDGQVRGVYSTIRALNSSIYPERFHKPKDWNWQNFAIRQFSILENCVDHPLFEQFVKFVCEGNPHLAEFAKLSVADQNEAFRKSKLLPGLNATYNQEKRDSKISEFASVRIAANL